MKKLFELLIESDATLEWEKAGLRARRDLQVCAAALLLHAGTADGHLLIEEVNVIVRRLADTFAVSVEHAAEIVEVGDVFKRSGRSLSDLILALNNRYERPQKLSIFSIMWEVFRVDGVVRTAEADFAETVARGFELTPDEIDQVRFKMKSA